MIDVRIRGGTVVTEGGIVVADVGIVAEQIVAIGHSVGDAKLDIDARDMLVLPGAIDPHVHLTRLPASIAGRRKHADDFRIGSRAAAAGGVTTIGNMTPILSEPTLEESLRVVEALASRTSVVDYVLHPELRSLTADTIDFLRGLWGRGYHSVKIYMVLEDFESNVPAYLQVMAAAAEAGAVVLLHCEDRALQQFCTQRLVERGDGGVSRYPLARPIFVESIATERAVAFSEATGATVYIVHLSSEEALAATMRGRRKGLRIRVETRPIYLHFTSEVFERPDAGLFIGNPPIRGSSAREALWAGLIDGSIDTVGTDHLSWWRADKLDPSRNVATARPGVPELETYIPLLFSEGVNKRSMSLRQFADVTSTNAARIFGLYPRKGVLAEGSDADVLILDPNVTRSIRGPGGQSRSDFSLYDGWDVNGWPVWTLSRGEVICERGVVTARAGRGHRV